MIICTDYCNLIESDLEFPHFSSDTGGHIRKGGAIQNLKYNYTGNNWDNNILFPTPVTVRVTMLVMSFMSKPFYHL